MSRDPYRSSVGDLGRGERWDRDRFSYERDRDRYGDERFRYEEDDSSYSRDYREAQPRFRPRVGSNRFEGRPPANDFVRERRFYYDDDLPPQPRRRAYSPPTAEFDRKLVIEKERLRSPSPPRRARPGMLRRQSSLDTFDRLPPRFYEQQERYGPPARREDYRPPPNVPIPLPRTRQLAQAPYYDLNAPDIDRHDDDYRPMPERVREKEIIHERRRDRSRESRASRTTHSRSHRGGTIRSSSRSSSTSSRSSSSSGGTTVKSEYPKKGKTRIPSRLVSKRALEDLGYPFIVEGNTIVVQKALGQDNIDDLLKLSEDYKKDEADMILATRPAPPRPAPVEEVIEERREEVIMVPESQPPPPPTFVPDVPPPPVLVRNPPPPQQTVEFVQTTNVVRDVSPTRTVYTTAGHGPVVVDARPREEEMAVAVVHHDHHHHRHRSRSHGREIVQAERLSNGELVIFEERVEKIEAPRRGVRIEKDKKGPPPGILRAMLATLT